MKEIFRKKIFSSSSLRKLHTAIRNAAHEDKTWFSDLENSNWLFHIRV